MNTANVISINESKNKILYYDESNIQNELFSAIKILMSTQENIEIALFNVKSIIDNMTVSEFIQIEIKDWIENIKNRLCDILEVLTRSDYDYLVELIIDLYETLILRANESILKIKACST